MENLEELQKETDEDRKYRMNFIDKEDKKKMEWVEKNLEQYNKRNIPVYIYAYLPTADDDGKPTHELFQYNNLLSVGRNLSEDDQKYLCHLIHMGLIRQVCSKFIAKVGEFQDRLNGLFKLIMSAIFQPELTKEQFIKLYEQDKKNENY